LDGSIHHFISGAGSEVRPVSGNTQTKFVASAHGFMAVSVNKQVMKCSFVNDLGEIIYQVDIPAQK
jgi:hypothetical protein